MLGLELNTTSMGSGGGVCADGTVNVNSNLFNTVASGNTLNVLVKYENGTPVGTIVGDTVKIPDAVTPSGIAYQRPLLTGQTTSYETYDDAWWLANGAYDYVPPLNPLYIAELDYDAISPYHRLKNNNAFGNKFRFTTVNGSYWNEQTGTYHLADGTLSDLANTYVSGVTQSSYVLDNLSGLGYYREDVTTYNFSDLINYPIGKTFAGFSDWRATNINEVYNLRNYDSSSSDDVTKYVLGGSTTAQAGTSTTFRGDITKYVHFLYYGTSSPIISQTKTTLLRLTMVRNHFN